jgi:integrase
MNTTAWKYARKKVNLEHVIIHDLRHTLERRLRAAGVSLEDRMDLSGNKSGRITTHYSMPELMSLIAAANAVCVDQSRKSPALTILRKKNPLHAVSNRAG